ncbi:MAG: two-component sensor histidine kinase, partial [Pseudomonadota bacterium]
MGNAGSVRFRLLAIALLPTLVVLPVFFAVTAWNWSGRFDELLITKVNSELTIASEYMSSILEDRSLRVGALANSARLAATTDDKLPELLNTERDLLGLDFLYAVGPGERGKWPIINTALAGTASNGIDIFASDDLRDISPTLASRARIPLVPTRAAVPTTRSEENRAMILHIAAPLPDGAGALVGGVLLNRNLGFIDTIN